MQPGTKVKILKLIPQYKLRPGQEGIYVKASQMKDIKTLHYVQINGAEYSLLDEEFEEVAQESLLICDLCHCSEIEECIGNPTGVLRTMKKNGEGLWICNTCEAAHG